MSKYAVLWVGSGLPEEDVRQCRSALESIGHTVHDVHAISYVGPSNGRFYDIHLSFSIDRPISKEDETSLDRCGGVKIGALA